MYCIVLINSRTELDKHGKAWFIHNAKCGSHLHVAKAGEKSKSGFVYVRGLRAGKSSAGSDEEEAEARADIQVGGGFVISNVVSLRHLGVLVDEELSFDKHLEITLGIMHSKFKKLGKSLWYNQQVSMALKAEMYSSLFVPSLRYCCHGLSMESREWKALSSFHNRCVRIIGKVDWKQQRRQHIRDEDIFKRTGLATLRHIWDLELLRTMARWNRKGTGSWGNIALTSYLPDEQGLGSTGRRKTDPIAKKFIATLTRLADVVERYGEENYNVYCDDGHDGEVIRIFSKQEIGQALRRGISTRGQEGGLSTGGGCGSRSMDELTWRQIFMHKALMRRLLLVLEMDKDVGCRKAGKTGKDGKEETRRNHTDWSRKKQEDSEDELEPVETREKGSKGGGRRSKNFIGNFRPSTKAARKVSKHDGAQFL